MTDVVTAIRADMATIAEAVDPRLTEHVAELADTVENHGLLLARCSTTSSGEATAKAMHWRENAVGAMMRALAGGCTPEHLAAVTGFDVDVVKRLLHKPRQEFNGRHPTDRHASGQERFYR